MADEKKQDEDYVWINDDHLTTTPTRMVAVSTTTGLPLDPQPEYPSQPEEPASEPEAKSRK